MIDLPVKVIKVLYPDSISESAWYVLLTDNGKCVGEIPYRPRENDQLILSGEWAVRQGEKQFKFSESRIDVPVNPRDTLHYVCGRTIGLGPAAESQLWDKLGPAWETATEGCISRLKGRVFAEFQLQIEGLHGKSEEAKVVATLVGKGATANLASLAWATWGKETLGVVQADPYRLAELPNYSFQDIDRRIRKEYGITDSDPRRIRSAVVYALRRLTDKGDTVVQYADLFTQACGLLGGYADEVGDAMGELFNDGTIKAFSESEGVSLKADWDAERLIWEYVENVGKQT